MARVILAPRREFFADVLGQPEEAFRGLHKWSLRNLFAPLNRAKWIHEFPRRAGTLFSGIGGTGIRSLGELKAIVAQHRPGSRPYFSVLVYDPYLPWETDIRYLQSIPQIKMPFSN